jgi:hypothetical protein
VEAAGETTASKPISPLRVRLIGFLIVAVASIIILTLYGASPLLIIEVFGLAAILGGSAIIVILVLGGRSRV